MLDTDDHVYVDNDLEDFALVLTIEQAQHLEKPNDDNILVNFLQNVYESIDILETMVFPSNMTIDCPFGNFSLVSNPQSIQNFLTFHQLLPHQCLYHYYL